MFAWLRPASVVLICLLVFMGLVQNATAHRRGGLPLVRPVPESASSNPAPPEKISGPLSLQSDQYWQRLLSQEQSGEFQQARRTGLALVNLFPQDSKRGAALLKVAALAAGQGDMAQALELYGLAVSLFPGTPEAAQAGVQAAILELSRDLSHGDPLPVLRRFLERVTFLPSGYAPDTIQEALKTGWQAVCQQARAADPPPLTLVEEILALWDLQPPGVGPPEAARLLADLLQEHGLFEEAQTLLTQGIKKTEADQRSRLQVPGLEITCLSRGWSGVADFLNQFPQEEQQQKFLLSSWLARWRAGVASSALPFEAPPAWLTSPVSTAGWEELLQPGCATPWAERLQVGLALTFWAEAHFSPAAQVYQTAADQSLRAANNPFSQDRLGMIHLKNGETDAAQQTFQDLAQHNDPFWRRLARVRLTDLELSRLQAEPSP